MQKKKEKKETKIRIAESNPILKTVQGWPQAESTYTVQQTRR